MRTENMERPVVSVIVPTLNAGPAFREVLEKLWHQSLRPVEIIVMDSSSTDETAELARRLGAAVYTISRSEFDHGGTRNLAASHAKGDILVFMTQDAVPANEHLLENLVRPLIENEQTACSYARQLPKSGAHLLEQLARSYNYPEHSMVKSQADLSVMGLKTFFCSNVCAAVRKEMFFDLGRFPEPAVFNEDLIFAAKCVLAGYAVAYTADAEVFHSHNYTIRQQFQRYFDNGVSIRMNDWVLPYSSIGQEGMRLVRLQLEEIVKRRKWGLVFRWFAEAAAKWLGFQLGKRYRMLPEVWCERFSMHRGIWNKMDSTTSRPMGVN
jgi:rhamnosyltransferase